MEILSTISSSARWAALGYLRYVMLVFLVLGFAGLFNQRWGISLAVLAIPGIYFGRFIYRGYQSTSTSSTSS